MTRDHDDDIVRRVHRTLAAVAQSTPIDPPRADDLRELQEIVRAQATAPGGPASTDPSGPAAPTDPTTRPLRSRHARRNGHGGAPRGRTLALAAAVLVVALAAAATWMLRPNPGSPPAVQTHDGGRLEATWLPGDLGGPEPQVTATAGLDVDLQAAVYRRQDADGTVVMATGPMDDRTADAVFEALNRLVRADQTGNWGGSGDAIPSAEIGYSTIAYGRSTGEENAEVISPVRDEGVAPADVRVDGWTTTPLPVDWVPGIVPSQTIRYGDPVPGSSCRESAPICPDAWAEVTTTAGTLPEPDVLDALLPNHGRMDVGDRTVSVSTWRDDPSFAADRQSEPVMLVLWQEAEGLIGSVMTHGLDDEAVLRIVEDARVADGPAPVEPVRPVSLMDGGFAGGAVEVDGVPYVIEAWEDSWRGVAAGPVQVCWHLRLGDDPPLAPSCVPAGLQAGFHQGVALSEEVVFGAVVPPEVVSLRADEGTVISMDVVSLANATSDPAQLAVVTATEEASHDVVISGLDADGAVVGTTELVVE